MKKNILIKTSTSNKNLWSKFINTNRWQNDISELVIDFSQCSFIEPFHVVQMACLIEEYHVKNVAITFIESETLALNEYLTNIQFFNYWQEGFNRSNYHQSSRMTNLCVWKLQRNMLTPYVTFAQRYFENNFLSEKDAQSIDFQPLYITLSELFNNIIDHSASPVSGFTTCQFYPQNHRLKIAVCDFGIGIPTLINRFLIEQGQQNISSISALKKAFENSFSTKSSPRNKGFGLNTLKTIIKNSNGMLRIISNDVMMLMNSNTDEQIFTIKHNFQGTLFEIILDTTTFDQQEDNLFDEEF
jgi:Histidine kinase-, DNA gyrase B-, and HSP90-like ATPase